MMRILYRRYKSIRETKRSAPKVSRWSRVDAWSLRPLLSLKERLSLFEPMETCTWVEDGKCDEGNDDLMVEEGEARGLESSRDLLTGLSSLRVLEAVGTWRGQY